MKVNLVFRRFFGNYILFALFFVGSLSCNTPTSTLKEDLNIRINQVGYLPDQIKVGMIFSKTALKSKEFVLLDAASKKEMYRNEISENKGSWGQFPFHYLADFSSFSNDGSFILEIAGNRSYIFKVGNRIYSHLVDSLLTFLTVQRCGSTNPKLHKICHIYDSPCVSGDNSVKGVDVTGGWHDAGDYVKFLNTTAYTTYALLLAYDLHKENLQFDNNKNGVPDILEEARVGIDWILRCNYKGSSLINQVQDNRDHEQGWRLPENDSLKYDRPAFKGVGKNLIGLCSASLTLGARIWQENFHDEEFVKKMQSAAEKLFASRNSVPDVDNTTSGMYCDRTYTGKLALGAIELYKTTNRPEYLAEAIALAKQTTADFWWSWGDINALCFFRMAPYMKEMKDNLLTNLTHFNNSKNTNLYGESTSFSWGTTHTFLGAALHSILWKNLTSTSWFDSLAAFQVDYIFGRNPWGVSFIYNFGTAFTKNFHNQVAYFNGGYSPGAIAAGPAPQELLKNYIIKRENSKYAEFNSNDVKYYDDRMDYITNEPTIVTNATAILLFSDSYYQRK